MAIQRNEAAEPQWNEWDYAEISKLDMFSFKRWRRTVDWEIILKQVEKTRQASQMIDIRLYPSKLFFAAIDLLEANLYMIDDMFYYLTGLRLIDTIPGAEEVRNRLGFWNMDCYKVLEQIGEGLVQTRVTLIDSLKHDHLWNIALKVLKKEPLYKHMIGDTPVPTHLIEEERTCAYARKHYEVAQIDQEALAIQIVKILKMIGHFAYYFHCIYANHYDFPKWLKLFRQSEKTRKSYIEPWRKDFGGTRDSLIAKMEKDPKLGPWVNRYDHLPKNASVDFQLFHDENKLLGPVNKEECYNTDNWLSILTVAAILQEYDELHGATSPTVTAADKHDDTALVVKLSLCFINEEVARKFLTAVRDMDDDLTIALVQSYQNQKLCTDTTIRLWRMLKDAGLYKASFSNWNKHMNKGYHKP
jgi:hypothetical protein